MLLHLGGEEKQIMLKTFKSINVNLSKNKSMRRVMVMISNIR